MGADSVAPSMDIVDLVPTIVGQVSTLSPSGRLLNSRAFLSQGAFWTMLSLSAGICQPVKAEAGHLPTEMMPARNCARTTAIASAYNTNTKKKLPFLSSLLT